MSASKPLQHSDFIDPEAVNKMKADFLSWLEVIKHVEAGIKGISAAHAKMLGGKLDSVDDLEKKRVAISKINEAEAAQIRLLQEKERMQKRIIDYKSAVKKADAEEMASSKAAAKAEKDKADAIAKANQLSKEEIRIAELKKTIATSEAGSLKQKKAQLALITIQINNMSEAQLKGTVAGRQLIATQKALTDQLGKTEQAGGNFHRGVGDYTGALIKLQKGLGGVTGLFSTLATAMGYDTTAIQTLHDVSKELIKTSKELHHVTELNEVAETARGKAAEESAGAEELHNAAMAQGVETQTAQTASTEVQNAAGAANVVQTEEQIASQEALNLTQAATPWGIILAGSIAVAAVVTAIAIAIKGQTKAEELRNKAIDGSIIKNKELRDSYNELLVSVREFSIDLEVERGIMTKERGEALKSQLKYQDASTKADNEYKASMIDATSGFWGKIGAATRLGAAKGLQQIGVLDKNINSGIILNQEAYEKYLTDHAKAKIELSKDQIKAKYKLDHAAITAGAEDELEGLRYKEALQEKGGQNIIAIKKEILLAESKLDIIRAQGEEDYEHKKSIIQEKYLIDLAGLEKEYAEQRRNARNQQLTLEISNMKDGGADNILAIQQQYDKQLATIKENYREQREQTLYDATLTENEKHAKIISLEAQYNKAELELLETAEAEKLKLIQDGNKKRLDNYIEYWNSINALDKESSTYQASLNEAANNIADAQLADDLQKKKITKKEYDAAILKNQLELNKQLSAIKEEQDQKDVDTEQRKYDLLLEKQKLGLATPEEVAAQQESLNAALHKLDIDRLNDYAQEQKDEVAVAKQASDARKKVYENELTQLSEFNAAIGKGLDTRTKAQEDALKTQSSQIESELQVQTALFAAGLDNTLDYEQKAKAENTEKQLAAERKAAKEKKGIELAQTYISFLQSYLKSDKPEGAASKALAQTLIAEGIADAISLTAFEGTEDTGGGGNIDDKGGMLAVVHPHERILPESLNSQLPGISNEELVRRALDWDNTYRPAIATSIPVDREGGSNSDLSGLIQLNIKSNAEVVRAISKIKTTNISVDDHKQIIEIVTEDNRQKTITHNTDPFRYYNG